MSRHLSVTPHAGIHSAACLPVCVQEAHESGVALVVAVAQEKAEDYCESLRLNGRCA